MKAAGKPRPIHLLAGGPGSRRSGKEPLLVRAIESCGIPEPSIAYIGAASGDNEWFFERISRSLRASGAGDVVLAPLSGRRVDLARTRSIIEESDMIFVSGGDVEEGMDVLDHHGLAPLLRALHRSGKPFFGLSAGSIMLGREWVVWQDPDDDATASAIHCLGIAPLVCDTHAEGDDWEELRALLRIGLEGAVGYGIPSGCGLLVQPTGEIEAVGGPVCLLAKVGGEVVRRPDIPPARRP